MRHIGIIAFGMATSMLATSCATTVLSRDSLGYLAGLDAGVEVRLVQPDPWDTDYRTRELWGFNRGPEPVCVGYRSAGTSWQAWYVAPGTEYRLIGLGSGYIEGAEGLVATMRNGEACTEGYIAASSRDD